MLHVHGMMSGQQVRGKGGKADSRARCGPPGNPALHGLRRATAGHGTGPRPATQDVFAPQNSPLEAGKENPSSLSQLSLVSFPRDSLETSLQTLWHFPHRELGTTSSPVTRDWPQHLPRAWDHGRRDAVRLPMAGGERPRGFRPARWDTVLQPAAAV